MIDRQKLETLLARRFPAATDAQIAAAANAIIGMVGAAGNPAVADGARVKAGEKRSASGLPLPPP